MVLSSYPQLLYKPGRIRHNNIAKDVGHRIERMRLWTLVVGLAMGAEPARPPLLRGVILENGSCLTYDAVVLAVPPARLKRVLRRPEAFGIVGLDDFQTAPIVDVHLLRLPTSA
jgi:hypothetical protein